MMRQFSNELSIEVILNNEEATFLNNLLCDGLCHHFRFHHWESEYDSIMFQRVMDALCEASERLYLETEGIPV